LHFSQRFISTYIHVVLFVKGVPLHGAAEYDSVEAAKILLDKGAEVRLRHLGYGPSICRH